MDRFEKIDILLQKRLEVYPKRDENFEKLQEAIKSFADKLGSDTEVAGAEYLNGSAADDRAFLDRAVFVGGEMKSGTSLLQQLIDNPQHNICFPGDGHFANRRDYDSKRSADEFRHYWVQRLITPTGKRPFWFVEKEWGKWQRLSSLVNAYTENGFLPFESVILGLKKISSKKSIQNPYWVEKTPHNEFHADWLLERYPNSKFLHVIRDPLTNLASFKRLSNVRGRNFRPWLRALRLRRLFQLAKRNEKKWGKERYKIVYYENLISNVEGEMKNICEFLGVPFLGQYCHPTENGVLAESNTMYSDDRTSGEVSQKGVNDRWKNEFGDREKRDIISILYDTIDKTIYPQWLNEDISWYYSFLRATFFHSLSHIPPIRRQLTAEVDKPS